MPSLYTIAQTINAELIGDGDQQISEPIMLDAGNVRKEAIMWCKIGRESMLDNLEYGAVICGPIERSKLHPQCSYLFVSKPRRAFQQVLKTFFQPLLPTGISPTAHIGRNVRLGEEIYIGHNVVIEDDCVIGDRCRIAHNTVIKAKTILGDHVVIGCNTSIGSDGFGYEKNEDSIQELIPHIGNVRIEDHVEIGDNVTIDKALLGSTIVGSHSKIDNLTYVAHGVVIGKNCLIIAGSVISGSTVISDDVWISPNATLMNKIHIGVGAMIGIGAVVLKDVAPETVVAGNPARPVKT